MYIFHVLAVYLALNVIKSNCQSLVRLPKPKFTPETISQANQINIYKNASLGTGTISF